MGQLTDKEVLQKAISIAMDNNPNYECYGHDRLTAFLPKANIIDFRGIIFSHDFAKAFWGEKLLCWECGTELEGGSESCCGWQIPKFEWRGRLQEMVIRENPIDYLRKFIEKDGDE